MFKFSEVAVWSWRLGQKRNRWAYKHLYANYDEWLLRFNSRNAREGE